MGETYERSRICNSATPLSTGMDICPKLLIDSLKGGDLLFKDDNIFVKEKIEFNEPIENGYVWLSCVFINETIWLDKKVNFDWLAGRVV